MKEKEYEILPVKASTMEKSGVMGRNEVSNYPVQVQTERGMILIETEYPSAEMAKKDGYCYTFTSKEHGDLYSKCLDKSGHHRKFAKITNKDAGQTEMKYRYYSVKRPVSPGSYSKPDRNTVLEITNFESKQYVEEIGADAWGYIEYSKPLNHFDVVDYELVAVKIKTLHLRYLGIDSWGRYVYEDENGKIWKQTASGIPRECCEERGYILHSSSGNAFDGEPDCHMYDHIKVEYLAG